MHKRVIRISSGGVHNICIVEAKPTCVLKDIYTFFMQAKFTNVVFKGFYQTAPIQSDNPASNNNLGTSTLEEANQTIRSQNASSDEEMQQDDADQSRLKEDGVSLKPSALADTYWREKSK